MMNKEWQTIANTNNEWQRVTHTNHGWPKPKMTRTNDEWQTLTQINHELSKIKHTNDDLQIMNRKQLHIQMMNDKKWMTNSDT